MDTFKILHAAENFTGTYSVLDVSLQQTVESIFNKLQSQKILILPLKKRKPITIFLVTLLTKLVKAATPQIIQKGFIRNRMIDKESNLWPCFDGMI